MATTVTLKPNAIDISGSTSGTTTLQATAVAGTTTLTLPAATDTLVGKATTDTLTNKTLTGAAMNGTLGATTPSTVAATSITASTTLGVTGVSTLTGGAVIEGLTVGRGGAGGAANTAYGASAIPIAPNSGVVAIGSNAGKLFNTASDTGQSTFVGYFAGAQVSTGTDSTFVGGSAGTSTTTGAKNTAVGSQALQLNTTASNNTAVGYQAGYSNTTGVRNSAFGDSSLRSNTTANNNNAFGYLSLYTNTTGTANAAFGTEALFSNTTASNNTAVGYQAGYSTTTGGTSTYIGYQAGYTNTTNDYNTYVGWQAGYTATGRNNTFVGIESGKLMTTGIKNTILGAYNGNAGGLDIRTASNYIVLSDGDGNPVLYSNNSKQWTVQANSTTSTSRGGNSVINLTAGSSSSSYDANYHITDAVANNVWFGLLSGNGYVMTNSGGVLLASGATSWSSASDSRLKNVTGTYQTALADISQIDVVKFTWKADQEAKPCVGVIAQSVQGVVPEAVDKFTENDEQYLSVRYTELIPLMIASIQELKAEVDILKAQINGASA